MKKVECPCKDCTHHGEPRCTHDASCYHGKEYAEWDRYHKWRKEQEYKASDTLYKTYNADRFDAIKRKYCK